MEKPSSDPYETGNFSDMLLDKLDRVPLLIEYFATCCIRQKDFLEYIAKAEETKTPLLPCLQSEMLKKSKLLPEITSRYPPMDKQSFPFPGDLENVLCVAQFL